MLRVYFSVFSALLLITSMLCQSEVLFKPEIQLASHYAPDLAVTDYLVSEKLDGVRGYWTGKQMLTKSGRIVNLPTNFTQGFPEYPIDGELWLGREQFEQISALVRRQHTQVQEWQSVSFMMFDLPQYNGTFEQRYKEMQQLVQEADSTHLKVIAQLTFADNNALFSELDRVVNAGGEGLMLHYRHAFYTVGRSQYIVKLKPKYDAEALVIGHTAGKGKYTGQLGALTVKTPQGKVFNIGSGLSDKQRLSPPAIGATITYQYLGFTQKGTPRFATFLRERPAQ
ncbi:DNA ligase [Shewanella ulleungensis]|uniref:ATP-dependent DNA ligase n=1 Tax=Shewanella ulleungensis TaxID=2282699 RepID=A0ABQ2QKX5_9GAMM|nr:DNA ligase [Shewanella ulleungensis]MCL1151827.1 DNA ligase [Shewanella ulleungensis]GGP83348.1 ATP-dependent DNA ligase [Shewanella ulleungensis]